MKPTPERAVLWVYVALYTATQSGNLDLSVSAENLSIAKEVTPVYL